MRTINPGILEHDNFDFIKKFDLLQRNFIDNLISSKITMKDGIV